jgi:Xaa-Pro aminopeptidase
MDDPRPARQRRVVEELQAQEADALLVTHLPNIRWLTGFTGTAALVVLDADGCLLVTDFRYATQAPEEVGAAATVQVERASVWGRVAREMAARGPCRLGFEAHALAAREASRLAEWPGVTPVPTGDVVERFRAVKDAGEVARIREAAELAQAALAEVLPTIRSGQRELDVAARLEAALRIRGSEWHPFETIVASGPRSALPHARTSGRTLAPGDLLLIDFGARVGGYCSDLTRTMVLGKADARQQEIHAVVEEAQHAARAAVRGGMTGREADAVARDLIAGRGYGDAFGHSLGHGVGLEVHEGPRLASTATGRLPVGAVVTVEPGIYLPGWGGVRLEDDVWLSESGPVLLTDGQTSLRELDP